VVKGGAEGKRHASSYLHDFLLSVVENAKEQEGYEVPRLSSCAAEKGRLRLDPMFRVQDGSVLGP